MLFIRIENFDPKTDTTIVYAVRNLINVKIKNNVISL